MSMENPSTSIPIVRPAQSSPAPVVKQTYPTEFIDLPSEGHFYPSSNPLSKGRVELKFMTAKEEDILTSQNLIKKQIVLDELLKALIVDPDIKLDDILVGDKNSIFVAARRLAYGDKYPVKIKCPSCGEDNEVDINLSSLKAKEFDFSKSPKGINSFEFKLSVSGKKITYKLLTNKDEADIDAEIKALEKFSKNGVSPQMTTRLKYMILAIDGNTDRSFIKNFVDTDLRAIDARELRKHIGGNNPDMDLTFNFSCSKCGHTARMAVPMGVDFFWPSN
jgi:rRNA maturation protein Nop10